MRLNQAHPMSLSLYSLYSAVQETCPKRGTADNRDELAKWRVEAAHWRGELEAPLDYKPWTSKHVEGTKGLSKRALDLVDCVALQKWKRARLAAGSSIERREQAVTWPPPILQR